MITESKLCPMQESVTRFPTDYWNDSCSVKELTYAIERGAVGATTNPPIVLNVLMQEMGLWEERIRQIITENPEWNEEKITWKLIEEMAVSGADLLYPVFNREHGKKGRLSIQTNPANYMNKLTMVEQAVHFNNLAPNMQVKIPATKAGIEAIEEATFQGVSINATVCFTVSQSIAVAEAVERGLNRRTAANLLVDFITPVCTIMVGRTDDWIKVLADKDNIVVDPAFYNWAGIACIKRASEIYQKRGYRSRLLAAAFRHHLHWSELIGGDIILTIPFEWQVRFNQSDIEVKERFSAPVSNEIIEGLYNHFEDFRKAYDEDGLVPNDFVTYGATGRTLRGFITAYHELIGVIRDFMLPDPDKR